MNPNFDPSLLARANAKQGQLTPSKKPALHKSASSSDGKKFVDELNSRSGDEVSSRPDKQISESKNRQNDRQNIASEKTKPEASEPTKARRAEKAAANNNKDKTNAAVNTVPILAFLTGHVEKIQPQSIPQLVAGNSFVRDALTGDVESLMNTPQKMEKLFEDLEIPDLVREQAMAMGLDMSQPVTPKDFLKSIGVDPNQVYSELQNLKNALPVDGFQKYMQRSAVLRGSEVPNMHTAANAEIQQSPLDIDSMAFQKGASQLQQVPNAVMATEAKTLASANILRQGSSPTLMPQSAVAPAHQAPSSQLGMPPSVDGLNNANGLSSQPSQMLNGGQFLQNHNKAATGDTALSFGEQTDVQRVFDVAQAHKSNAGRVSLEDLARVIGPSAGESGQTYQLGAASGEQVSIGKFEVNTNANPQGNLVATQQPLEIGKLDNQLNQLSPDVAAADAQMKQALKAGSERFERTLTQPAGLGQVGQNQSNLNLLKTKVNADDLQVSNLASFVESETLSKEFEGDKEFSGDQGAQNFRGFDNTISQLSQARAESSASVSGKTFDVGGAKPVQDNIQLVQEIMDKATALIQKGGGSMKLNMNSQDLGRIDLAVQLSDNRVDLKILTQSDKVRDLIAADIAGLRENLGVQNIQLGNVDVGVGERQQSGFDMGQQQREFSDWQDQQQQGAKNFGFDLSEAMSEKPASRSVTNRFDRNYSLPRGINHNGSIEVRA